MLTVMPRGPRSRAIPFVQADERRLAERLEARPGPGDALCQVAADRDDARALVHVRRCGLAKRRMPRACSPRRVCVDVFSVSVTSSGLRTKMPALLTRISSSPNSATVRVHCGLHGGRDPRYQPAIARPRRPCTLNLGDDYAAPCRPQLLVASARHSRPLARRRAAIAAPMPAAAAGHQRHFVFQSGHDCSPFCID